MTGKVLKAQDANEAVAAIAYKLSEVVAIYPITPATSMGEAADDWAAMKVPNLWGSVPTVIEMQSEGGVAGAIHGSLLGGSLSTTFTSSQGLLLMIPNMYKIAGELTPAVFHVATRSLATYALSMFGDHADVMAVRGTGWAMLCASTVQEAQDMALVAHSATLECRVPFLHFFDGFRTSHEINKIEVLPDSVIRAMVSEERIREVRARAMSPDRPTLRGTAQNPDVYFQGREAANPFYDACVRTTQAAMDRLGELTGRHYRVYEYHGAPDADRVVVAMGSGCETLETTADWLNARGAKVGVVKIRLFRPFDAGLFDAAIPSTVRAIAVLDRTKEPGGAGEPLFQDAVTALMETGRCVPVMVGGRYGLASKEFTPAMAKAVFDNLAAPAPRNHFTVGIVDDLQGNHLEVDESFDIEPDDVFRAVFYGLGSDGTVGANKDTTKIIAEHTPNHSQAYFVYDPKKAGATTISHLRFGPRPIRAPYLISKANFIGCHHPVFLERMNVAQLLADEGVMILNSPASIDRVWDTLPPETQADLIAKRARLYVIDASTVAREAGMGNRVNTIMQVCFFSVSGVLPRDDAIRAVKDSVRRTYARKGEEVIAMNLAAIDKTLERLKEVRVPATVSPRATPMRPPVIGAAPLFVRDVIGEIIAGRGDLLPTSKIPVDGTFPIGTTRFEKRNIAAEIPEWDSSICIQCGKCTFVCPHSAIRSKAYGPSVLDRAPAGFASVDARLPGWKGLKFTIQVAPEDCTGCGLCVDVCPVKNKIDPRLRAINMVAQPPIRTREVKNWDFFVEIPNLPRASIATGTVREMQAMEPYFEFSGACAGCGETPYVRLVSQLFGDRLVVANASGCSSVYGGALPTTPWAADKSGRGTAWANSLFEDNAEFGLGIRVAMDQKVKYARELLTRLRPVLDAALVDRILSNPQATEADIHEQRGWVSELKAALAALPSGGIDAIQLLGAADSLVRRSVWIMGGDGWAYDIGYGGLDHVLASGANVKVLVLDTEVYSNTGGQCSKATPRGAVAKFAASGKPGAKKDLGLIAMSYGNIYVASVAMGAKDEHTLRAIMEAEAYPGPALIVAYSHCIAHGINMAEGLQHQKVSVGCGHWMLYRYNPDRIAQGLNPLQIDSPMPSKPITDYLNMENRFKILRRTDPEAAVRLANQAQADVWARWERYQHQLALGEVKAKAARERKS